MLSVSPIRRLTLPAKKYHPDAKSDVPIPENQEQLFKQITEAYSILSDKDLRLKYDRLIFGESAINTSSSFEN